MILQIQVSVLTSLEVEQQAQIRGPSHSFQIQGLKVIAYDLVIECRV